MSEKKKQPDFLRWPWNVLIYILLAVTMRLFSIPIILLLMDMQRRNNPHGAAEGYCLSRTRKRLSELLWALLLLFIGAALSVFFFVELKQGSEPREPKDYLSLALSGVGGAAMLLFGLWAGWCAVRDTFFPARSALAKSIRGQLPYPEDAPPVEELFAMVDRDLKENGEWFDAVGIGREWVLGDQACRIDRIRGIFAVDELHQRHTQTGVRTNRSLQLVLFDDRWQTASTTFTQPGELRAAAEYLSLRVPAAARGGRSQYLNFLAMDDIERERFELEFRRKQALQASAQASRDMLRGGGRQI
ncbi:MAG: hypothetical protein K2N94_14130 [Lachnospiraceae bacterium]|nr:hypothetical protein [Lachnospiraceae bacterium]